ncbi:MAG: ABC transporter permease [Rhabdochlamydiaceae bacterium]|nr:ABC transporter permease [Candidatus Amphrikana amoebophyrae]
MSEITETVALSLKSTTSKWKAFVSMLKLETPFIIGVPAIVWQLLFFYIPIFFMITTSFFTYTDTGALSFSIEHFTHIWKTSYLSTIGSSLIFSLSTATLCFAIGFPLAHFIAFRGGKYKTIFLFLLIVPFWTNFLLHIYAWFFVLEKEGFLNTILLNLGVIDNPLRILNTHVATMIMMVYYYLPFMTLPIYSSLDKFDHSLIEASHDLGAGKFQTFRRILLPISMNSIRAGFFLVFIPAFGEFVIPELMGGDKDFYVGNVIAQFILGDETGQLGTAYTVLSISVLLLTISVAYLGFNKFAKVLTGRTSQ